MVCQQGLVLGWVVIARGDGVWLSRVTKQGWILQSNIVTHVTAVFLWRPPLANTITLLMWLTHKNVRRRNRLSFILKAFYLKFRCFFRIHIFRCGSISWQRLLWLNIPNHYNIRSPTTPAIVFLSNLSICCRHICCLWQARKMLF